MREWLKYIGVPTLFIDPGSPWENGYNKSFNGKLGDELLNGEIFYALKEAQILIENTILSAHVHRSAIAHEHQK